jgi:hypothetical protein
MDQIEQWFISMQKNRWRISDFSDLDHLTQWIMAFGMECASTTIKQVDQVRSQGYSEGRYSSHLGCDCMTFDLFLCTCVRRSSYTCDRCVMVELTIVMAM